MSPRNQGVRGDASVDRVGLLRRYSHFGAVVVTGRCNRARRDHHGDSLADKMSSARKLLAHLLVTFELDGLHFCTRRRSLLYVECPRARPRAPTWRSGAGESGRSRFLVDWPARPTAGREQADASASRKAHTWIGNVLPRFVRLSGGRLPHKFLQQRGKFAHARIVAALKRSGHSLLDPFCGCGVSLMRRPRAPWHAQHDRHCPPHAPCELVGCAKPCTASSAWTALVMTSQADCAASPRTVPGG